MENQQAQPFRMVPFLVMVLVFSAGIGTMSLAYSAYMSAFTQKSTSRNRAMESKRERRPDNEAEQSGQADATDGEAAAGESTSNEAGPAASEGEASEPAPSEVGSEVEETPAAVE